MSSEGADVFSWDALRTTPGRDESQDFGFGQAYYLSADYAFEVLDGLEIGFHVGYHDGDFNEAFNGVDGSYFDYNAYIARGGFAFMIGVELWQTNSVRLQRRRHRSGYERDGVGVS